MKALLLMFGTYIPPATSLSATMNIPAASRSIRVPQDILTDKLVDEIKTRICFVGEPIDPDTGGPAHSQAQSPDPSEHDLPPSDPALSESEFSRVSADIDSSFSAQSVSGFSVVSHSQLAGMDPALKEDRVQALATMYGRHSTATDIHMRVDPPPSQQTGTGRGTLIIPGWIRERAAEVLFEGGDVDESSVAEVILDTLLKVRPYMRIYPLVRHKFISRPIWIGPSRSPENPRICDSRRRGHTHAPGIHSPPPSRAYSRREPNLQFHVVVRRAVACRQATPTAHSVRQVRSAPPSPAVLRDPQQPRPASARERKRSGERGQGPRVHGVDDGLGRRIPRRVCFLPLYIPALGND